MTTCGAGAVAGVVQSLLARLTDAPLTATPTSGCDILILFNDGSVFRLFRNVFGSPAAIVAVLPAQVCISPLLVLTVRFLAFSHLSTGRVF
jgi:hypothetical protein